MNLFFSKLIELNIEHRFDHKSVQFLKHILLNFNTLFYIDPSYVLRTCEAHFIINHVYTVEAEVFRAENLTLDNTFIVVQGLCAEIIRILIV